MSRKLRRPENGKCLALAARSAVILLAISAAGLWGCAAVPQSKYYQLSAPAEVSFTSAADSLPITLLVGPMKASHLYREDRLVYSTGGEEMGTYQQRRWAAPPTEMVQELLWRSLRTSHRYSAVNLLSSSSRGDFLLQGNLYDFKEVSGSMLTARLDMALELRNIKTGEIVWTHEYSHDEPVNGKDVVAVVKALDENAQHGVSESVAGLNEYFGAHSKK